MEVLCPATAAKSEGLLIMRITKHIAARTLIWLVAIAVPVQGLPAASCGCPRSISCCQKTGQSKVCCCSAEQVRAGRCCCTQRTGKVVQSSCCKAQCWANSSCRCGVNCRCGETEPPSPAALPVENSPTRNSVSDAVSTISVTAGYQPQLSRRPNDTSAETGLFTALDRCVSLCRFTL